ncbi:SPFH domain-containing protein [Candidatus Woesearchaeota archaeon]|nr:SPFH domain-containing protein [Candidatus Woesearchaeota archaeon]
MTLHQKPAYEDITLLTTILPHQNGVRTYLGRLVDVLPPGPYLGLPKIHKIAKVDMRVQVHGVKMNAVTRDNYGFPLQMDLLVRVQDAGKYMTVAPESVTYGIEELVKAAVTHEVTDRFTQEDLKTKRQELGDLIKERITAGTGGWGIGVDLARIPEIAMPSRSYELEQEKMVLQKEGKNRMVKLQWTAQAVERETAIMTRRLRDIAIAQSDMKLYSELQRAAASAYETQRVGEAQATVLSRKAEALQGFMTESVQRLITNGFSPVDAKELMMYSVGLVFGSQLQNVGEAATDGDTLRGAILSKVKARIDGEAQKAQADAAEVEPKFMMLMNTFRAISGAGNLNINNWGALWDTVGKDKK